MNKYELANLNYNFLFADRDEKMDDIIEDFWNRSPEKREEFFQNVDDKDNTFIESGADRLINYLTLSKGKLDDGYLDNLIGLSDDGVSTKNGKFAFYLNNHYIFVSRIKDMFPILDEESLYHDDLRKGMCHIKSLELAQILTINVLDASVVTGYVSTLTRNINTLHSVVEFDLNGKKYVIDYTKNVVMNKDGYDYLYKFRELSRLDSTELGDFDIIRTVFGTLNNKLDLKTFLTVNDELVNETNKVLSYFNE